MDHPPITSLAVRDRVLRDFVRAIASKPDRRRACSGHPATRIFLQYKTGNENDGRYAQKVRHFLNYAQLLTTSPLQCLTEGCSLFQEMQYLSDPLRPQDLDRIRELRLSVNLDYATRRQARSK